MTNHEIDLQYSLASFADRTVWSVSYSWQDGDNPLDLPAGKYTLVEFGQASSETAQQQIRARLKPAERLCSLPEHPNVATVLALARAKDHEQIWLEPLEGGTLEKLVKSKGALEPSEVTRIAEAFLAGLSWLEQEQIAFSEITGNHLAFSTDGTPKLLAPDLELRGLPLAKVEQALAQNSAQVAALLWWAISGSPAGSAQERIPLPLKHPEYGAELAKALESAMDQTPDAASLAEIVSLLRHKFGAGAVNLHASAHPSVRGSLPAAPSAALKQKPSGGALAGLGTKKLLLAALALVLLLAGGASAFWLRAQPAASSEQTAQNSETVQPLPADSADSADQLATPPLEASQEGSPETSQETAPVASSGMENGQAVDTLKQLIEARNYALNSSNAKVVRDYAAADSALYRQDAALIAQDKEGQLSKIQLELVDAEVLENTDSNLKIRAKLQANNLDPAKSAQLGEKVKVEDGVASQTVNFTLVKEQDRWKLAEALPQDS